MFDDLVKQQIKSSVLCWLATVDVFVQKGFKIQGSAQIVKSNHVDYSKWAESKTKLKQR